MECRSPAFSPGDHEVVPSRSVSAILLLKRLDSLRDSVILSVLIETKEESCKRDRAAFCAAAGSPLDYREGCRGEHCFSPRARRLRVSPARRNPRQQSVRPLRESIRQRTATAAPLWLTPTAG